MKRSKLLDLVLPVALLCSASALRSQTTTTLLNDQFAASGINAGLVTDVNSYLVPTSTQAVWATSGTTGVYTQNTGITMSASSSGNRELLAYFEPSTSVASLAVGQSLNVSLSLKFNTAAVNGTGFLRLGLLDSNNTYGNYNVAGSTNALNATRPTGAAFSGTTGSQANGFANGYSGYVVQTTIASGTGITPSDPISFWNRLAATDPSNASGSNVHKGSGQWVGGTGTNDISANSSFSQIGSAGGGSSIPNILSDASTVYTLSLSANYVSANQLDLNYSIMSGSTVIESYSVSQTSGLVTDFDTVVLLSALNSAYTVSNLKVAMTTPSAVPEPSTYALIVGAVMFAGAAMRRRFA